MSLFSDVTLHYGEDDYVVKADQVMRLIAIIEDHISLGELTREQGPPFGKLASAYSAALRFAGCRVSDEQVYAGLFGDDASRDSADAVTGLLFLMVPPSTYQPDQKKAAPAKRQAKAKRRA